MTDLPPMPSVEQRSVAFDFARKLRDPDFRDYLRSVGWTSELTPIWPVAADVPVGEVFAGLRDGDPGPVLLACPDPGALHGWAVVMATTPEVKR